MGLPMVMAIKTHVDGLSSIYTKKTAIWFLVKNVIHNKYGSIFYIFTWLVM